MKTKPIFYLFLILSVCLLISCNETPDKDTLPETDFEFSLDSNGEVSVTAYIGHSSETVTIPSEYDGHPVTSIADEAFADNLYLRSVIIPETINKIGSSAFSGCINLKNAEIGKEGSDIVIGVGAFEGCTALESVILRSSVSMIPQSMFAGCSSLKSFDIPKGARAIGPMAFSGCLSITEIDISNSVTSIGADAFISCKALKEIHLPEGLTEIRMGTFAHCESLSDITIPESVTKLGPNAFYGCDSLVTIHIPKNVEEIDYASMGAVFTGKKLSSVTVSPENTNFFVSDGLLYENETGNVIGISEFTSSVIIPAGVVNAYNITSETASLLSIPSSLEHFNGELPCLESLEVSPENDVYKSESGLLINSKENSIVLYTNESKADTVTIPDGITSLDYNIFDNADYVKHIVIGDVKKVYANVFADMESLTDVTFESTATEFLGAENYEIFKELTIYAPFDSKAYNYAKENGLNVESLTE